MEAVGSFFSAFLPDSIHVVLRTIYHNWIRFDNARYGIESYSRRFLLCSAATTINFNWSDYIICYHPALAALLAFVMELKLL